MALISEATVRRGLRGLSDERALAFVAALWSARGAETTVDHERNVVDVRRDGREETFRVVTGRRVPETRRPDERLVVLRPADGVRGVDPASRVVDADDIRALLLYGVPREAATTLCRRYFDRPLVVTGEPQPGRSRRLTGQSASLAAGVVGLLLVVASVFGGPFLAGGTPSELGAAVGGQSFGELGAQTSVTPGTNGTDEAGTVEGGAERSLQTGALPPGVAANGDIDEDVLANAHARAVTGRSYRWTLTHRELVDGRETAYRRETVFVETPNRYRTELTGAGRLRESTLSISSVEAYADGSSRFEQRVSDDGFDRVSPRVQAVRGIQNDEGRYADRAEQYLEWYLSVSESSIADVFERNGTRYVWLTLGADPYVGVENSSGSVLVDENGVVHEIRRQYDVPRSDGVSAVVSFRYTDFGATTVSPPSWYESGTPTPTEAGENSTATSTPAAPTAEASESSTSTPTSDPATTSTNGSASRERVPATTAVGTTAKSRG